MSDMSKCTMAQARIALARARIRFDQKSPYQIKIRDFNFYPSTGKITIDRRRSPVDKGLDGLFRVLRQAGLLPDQPDGVEENNVEDDFAVD